MNILLIVNVLKPEAVDFAAEISSYLNLRQQKVYVLTDAEMKSEEFGAERLTKEKHPLIDTVIIVGGDGTVLRNISILEKLDAPILGINFGHLGYLTACEPADAKACIDEIISGGGVTEQRILLKGSITGEDGKIRAEFEGLNEVSVYRAGLTHALNFNLLINDNVIGSFAADGILAATPTGSTAYNLTAGGPILMPTADNLVITPVCSNAMPKSAIVASGTDSITLKIEVPKENIIIDNTYPLLIVDSREKHTVFNNDIVKIGRAPKRLRFYKQGRVSFYKILQKKLMRTI